MPVLSPNRVESLRVLLMAEEHKARVGARIRKAREEAGLAQSALARQLPGSVDGPSISRYERGEVLPGPDRMGAIAKALGVPVAYFYAEQPEAGTADLMGALNGSETQLDRIERKLDEVLTRLQNAALDGLAEAFQDLARDAGTRAPASRRSKTAQR